MKNKKLLIIVAAVVLVVALVAVLLVVGGKKEYKLGMGVVVGMNESKDGLAQVDATVATVVLDDAGKIVACRIDAVQNKATLNADGTYTVTNLKTKMEQGNDYGMTAALNYGMDWNKDGVVKEWHDQAKAFETYVVGMTAAQVKAMGTQEVPDKGYIISNDEALLSAGCTIQITDFKAAVAKACEDAQGVTFKAKKNSFTLGVAAESTAEESVAATATANGTVKMYADFAASVVVDGKIVASLNDAIQPNVTYTVAGKLVETSFKATKRELKGDYGMAAALNYGMDWNKDGVVKEWYEQSAVFSAHVVGMTADQVKAMGTQEVPDKGYIISNDEALLSAGCTIQITAIKAVVAESVTNAR